MKTFFICLAWIGVNLLQGACAIDVEDPRWTPFDKATCQANNNKNCPNACAAAKDGSTCCFCDDSKNYQMSICSCCPKNTFCCPPTDDTRAKGSKCCPVGTTCLDDGKCKRFEHYVAVYAKPVCSPTCPKDAYIWITCDNFFTMYFNGKPQKLQYADDWTKVDKIMIPRDTKWIAIAGENKEYDAGFLVKFVNPWFDTTVEWLCTDKLPEGEWTKPGSDLRGWKTAVTSEPNVARTESWQRDQIAEMLGCDWFWSNIGNTTKDPKAKNQVPWNTNAFCVLVIKKL